MRIVLDTNVVISALLWRGLPYQLLATLRVHPAAQLYSSPVLLAELTDVLTRPTATRQLAAVGSTPRAALSAKADVIVSGDADLLSLGSVQNIRILAPRDAFAVLAERSG